MTENHTQNRPAAASVEHYLISDEHRIENIYRTDQEDFATRHLEDDPIQKGTINNNQDVLRYRRHTKKNYKTKNEDEDDILEGPSAAFLGCSSVTDQILLNKEKQKSKKKYGVLGSGFIRFSERIKTYFLPRTLFNFFTSWMFIYTCKSVIALALTFIFIFVNRVGDWFGGNSFLLQLAVVFFDMSAAPGFGIMYACAASAMGGFILGWTKLAIHTSIHNAWGMAAWLAFILFMIHYWRDKVKPKWQSIAILASIQVILIIIYGFRAGVVHVPDTLDIFKTVFAVIVATWICAIVNIVVFPHTAWHILIKELYGSNQTMIEIIEFTVKVYTGDIDLNEDELAQRIQALDTRCKMHFMAIIKAQEALRNELYISSFSPKEAKQILGMVMSLVGLSRILLSCCRLKEGIRLRQDMKELVATLSPQIRKLMIDDCVIKLKAWNKHISKRLRIFLPIKKKKSINLSQDLTEFDNANKTIIAEGLIGLNKQDNWADLFICYFYICICREYVKKLDDLDTFINKKNRKIPRIYMPLAITEWILFWFDKIFHAPKHFIFYLKATTRDSIPARNKELTTRKKISTMFRATLLLIVSLFYSKSITYGFKCALAVFLATLPQWIENSRGWYAEWRCEFVAIYVAILFGPTFAASYAGSLFRVIGVYIGALVAILTYVIFGLKIRVYGIIIVWTFFAFPCFLFKYSGRVIGKIAPGAFVTYASTVIIDWQNRDTPHYFSFWELVYKRLVSITIGIIIVLLLDRILWPILAKDQASSLLAQTIKGLSKMYSLCIDVINTNADPKFTKAADALTASLKGSLVASESLLLMASKEPTLHDPIPYKYYQAVSEKLTSIFQISIITKLLTSYGFPDWFRRDILAPIRSRRRKTEKYILVLFWICEKVVATKTALPQGIKSVTKKRRRLIESLQEMRSKLSQNKKQMEEHSTELVRWFSVVLLYQYLLAELDDLLNVLVRIYGQQVSIVTDKLETRDPDEQSEEGEEVEGEDGIKMERMEKRRGKEKQEERPNDETATKTHGASTDDQTNTEDLDENENVKTPLMTVARDSESESD